jgi:dienelactone hydrolase
MSHEHCVSGSIHTGNPIGKEDVIEDRKTYITGTNTQNALLYLTDVFGYDLPNHRLLADTFAAELPVTVYVPDFLDESAFPQDEEKRKNIDFGKFAAFNAKDKRFPQILKVAEHLRGKYERVFTIGYCWGAWGCFMLAAKKDLITAVSVNHPSALEIPGDLERIKSHVLIVAPYTDPQFPPESRAIAEEIFDKKAKEEKIFSKIAVYPGFVHGFAARGDTGDVFTNGAIEDAKDESVRFFKRFIK